MGALVFIGVTAFKSPAKSSPVPYTINQAAAKIVKHYDPLLSPSGAAVATAGCVHVVKTAAGKVVVDSTAKSGSFLCVLDVVSMSTDKTEACEGVYFSLPAGADKPKVNGTQSLDPATYCSST